MDRGVSKLMKFSIDCTSSFYIGFHTKEAADSIIASATITVSQGVSIGI
jgi:hypothetical protein